MRNAEWQQRNDRWLWTRKKEHGVRKNIRRCTRCGVIGSHDVEWEVASAQWVCLIVLLLCGILPGILYGLHLATGGGEHGLWVCESCGARRASVPATTAARFFVGCEIKPGDRF